MYEETSLWNPRKQQNFIEKKIMRRNPDDGLVAYQAYSTIFKVQAHDIISTGEILNSKDMA